MDIEKETESHSEGHLSMLEYMQKPAFLVRDGIIIAANHSARNRMIEVGSPVAAMLSCGAQDYASFSQGILYLSLKAGELTWDATVTALDADHLFVLDCSDAGQELQALSKAAMHLREPMSTLMISTDKLMGVKDRIPELADLLGRMNLSLHQMLRMVSNMSDPSRYLSSKISNLEMSDARSTLEEIFGKASLHIGVIGNPFTLENLTEPLHCLLDKEKLERAIYNLLSNAVRFSPAGSPIEARVTTHGGQLYISVTNETAPSAEPLRPDLFHSYTREPSLEDAQTGIGLGMVMVRIAASAHRGTVLATQKDGVTCVTMTLAIIKPDRISVSSPNIMHADYAGEHDHGLLELSDVLPSHLYKK